MDMVYPLDAVMEMDGLDWIRKLQSLLMDEMALLRLPSGRVRGDWENHPPVDPSTQTPPMGGGLCSGFRPKVGKIGTAGMPAGSILSV